MKVSTRGRYAIRFLLDLANNDAEQPIRIKEVAERQDISEKYLEQVVALLNKSGMVKSVRGPQGGYMLTKKPEEYIVGDILRLTEGDMAPVACLVNEVNSCPHADTCATLPLWKELNQAICDVIDHRTLADLMDA